jgi:polyisoprenyl-phosphate glycosyltransferase
MSTPPTICIVIPVFNEEALLELLHESIENVLKPMDILWRVYYVDDGSTDRSLAILKRLQEQAPEQVSIAQLSRNWGHQPAITAGLSLVDGDATIIMDADMQDPPHVIPKLIEAWLEGAKVVEASRLSRAEGGVRGLLFRSFYAFFNWLTDNQLAMNSGVFGLMDRQVVDILRDMPERNRYLPGMRSWLGFPVAKVPYHREDRVAGAPKQTLMHLLRYGADATFSFSLKPLRLSTFIGLSISAVSILGSIIVIFMRLTGTGIFHDNVVLGFTTLFSTIVILSGVQLASLGILGEYVGRTFDEAKARPFFVIQKVWPNSDKD